VLIERSEIPSKAQKQEKTKRIILAHGEVTGHHHTLETRDPADWWKGEGEIPATNEKPSTLAGELFVSLPNGGTVKHQEHSKIELPRGKYRITRQREYSPERIRNVAD